MSNTTVVREQASPRDVDTAELKRLVHAITELEAIVGGWDSSRIATVEALKSAIEALHKEALRRLIRSLKEDVGALARLREAVADPIVQAVLQFHGLLRVDLETRLERALDTVRPFIRAHGGDVELVRVVPPDTADIRLIGACHGCAAASETLRDGVERAIRIHCPEIQHIRQVNKGPAKQPIDGRHVNSPFAARADQGLIDVAQLDEIPDGGIIERSVGGRSVLLSRRNRHVTCFDNACAHMGMPLETGEVAEGIITCAYHGFRYLLETGECLTSPEAHLAMHTVRLSEDRVAVCLED